jgi:nitrate/nitrite-specific signal transduction histidine kinase
MAATIEQRMEKLTADVEALSQAIQADESEDQSDIREEMGKLHQQFTALIEKAKAYAARAQKLKDKADAEQENTQNFFESADELVTTLEAASEAMDPDQWDWGNGEEAT